MSGVLAEAAASAVVWNYGLQVALSAVDARLGIARQNDGRILSHYGGGSQADRLPSRWVAGLSKSLAHLPFTFHVAVSQADAGNEVAWQLGGEFRLPGSLAFRWGVDQGKPDYLRGAADLDLVSGLSLGLATRPAGGRWNRLQLDSTAVRLHEVRCIRCIRSIKTSTASPLKIK